MSDKRYVVPEGGLKAFMAMENHLGLKWDECALLKMLEAFIRWQSENPIRPTYEQSVPLTKIIGNASDWAEGFADASDEWQRRMYLAPEQEISEEIKDLLLNEDAPEFSRPTRRYFNTNLVEAYRRGQKAAVRYEKWLEEQKA